MSFSKLLRRCSRTVRLQPAKAWIVLSSLLLINIFFLYLLSAHPSPWVTKHGSFVPRGLGRGRGEGACGPLRFADPPLPVTALASVPGSGNTWLRHLLQQATGIMTGSMYNDSTLYTSGFPGEGVNNGSVLVVKTHSSDPEVRGQFRRAILLLRQPHAAILSEFHRQHGGHLGHASRQHFDEDWETFVPEEARFWRVFNTEWLQFAGPLHIVCYEDLRHDLNSTLSKLLGFLNVPVDRKDFECALRRSRGKFKRRDKSGRASENHSLSEVFTRDMKRIIGESDVKFHEELKKFYHRRSTWLDPDA
ncbi:hypothetical protein BaRGS_00034393 [Batillaria attramentaria]|uniref:Sulfotransferase domain-containing protein n=1 Tax=Batillaria attramentaria TaxID=370345 RepID=A0ABD0JHZ7_9CAEN